MTDWIKASERLPEDGRRVIVCGIAKMMGVYGEGEIYIGEAYWAHKQWNSYGFHSFLNVTHWTPLPERPSDE